MKEYNGYINLRFHATALWADDDESLLDALFPDGFNGEILGYSDDEITCTDEDTGEDIEPDIGA